MFCLSTLPHSDVMEITAMPIEKLVSSLVPHFYKFASTEAYHSTMFLINVLFIEEVSSWLHLIL